MLRTANFLAQGVLTSIQAGLLAGALVAHSAASGEPDRTGVSDVEQTIEIRGHVLCFSEHLQSMKAAEVTADHAHLWVVQGTNGVFYPLVQTKLSEALFLDPRLRGRPLLLKGRLFPRSLVFEPATIRSLKDGVVQDLYYYCEVCAIKTVTPRECACCRAPVELIEKPLDLSK